MQTSLHKYFQKKKNENILDFETRRSLSCNFKSILYKNSFENFEELKDLYSTEVEIDSITCIDSLKDNFIFGSSSGDVKILKFNQEYPYNYKEVRTFNSKKRLSCVKFQNEEKFVISSSVNNFIYQYDFSSNNLIANFKSSTDIFDFKVFNDSIYCGCRDGSIQMIDTRNKISKNTKIQSQGSINSVLIDSYGQLIYTASDKGFISLFDIRFPSKILKCFDLTKLQQTSLERNRFSIKERVMSRNTNSTPNSLKRDELQKFDFSEQPSKERDMLNYFSLKKQNISNIQSLVFNPYFEHLIAFQLLNLTVGLLDIQKGRILKMYQNDKEMSSNNIQNHYNMKRKPSFISNSFGSSFLAPIGNEIIILDWNDENEELLFEIHDKSGTKSIQTRDESQMVIKKIPLSGHPSCIHPLNSSRIICGTGNNNILIIGEKEN